MNTWYPTNQAAPETWFVCYWRDLGRYMEAKYTHERGWISRANAMVDPPSCWTVTPESETVL